MIVRRLAPYRLGLRVNGAQKRYSALEPDDEPPVVDESLEDVDGSPELFDSFELLGELPLP